MKMCLNWKVLAGLAVIGVVLWLVAPGLLGAALPVLLVAACPLSMLLMAPLMMRGRMQDGGCSPGAARADTSRPERPGQEDEVAALKERLAALQHEQERLSHEIARHKAADGPAAPSIDVGELGAQHRRAGRQAEDAIPLP